MEIASDVVVIGAGPSGSTAANEISTHGFNVILVEKDDFPGKTNVCAGGMPMSTFDQLGLDDGIIEKRIVGSKHNYPWGFYSNQLNFITVSRLLFDSSLAEKAVKAGTRLITGTAIKDISIDNDAAHAISRDHIFTSKLIVIADGPNTLAYRNFGIGFKPESDNTVVSTACEIEWENNPLDHYEYFYGDDISPWGYGWIFPKKDSVNVGLGCLHSKLKTDIMDLMDRLFQNISYEEIKHGKIKCQASALIPASPAKKIYGERMVVVGDAAGMVDPISCGGISHAILAGKIAGEVCIKAMEANNFSSRFLSEYQKRWQKTSDHYYIYFKYLLSTIYLYRSKFEKNAFSKIRR